MMRKNNRSMSDSDVRFTKILFQIIGVLLILFFVSGIYFMKSSAMGAGFLGVGIALLGFGIMGLFADGILYQAVDPISCEPGKRKKKQANVSDIADPEFQMDAVLGYVGNESGQKNGVIYLCSDRIYLKHLESDNVQILYSDIKHMMQQSNRFVIEGMFNIESHLKQASVYISCDSAIQLKAFVQVLDGKLKRYNNEIAVQKVGVSS